MTFRRVALTLLIGVAFAVFYVMWANVRDESPIEATAGAPVTAAEIERGRYLTLAGNCMACHTQRGGLAFAGGRAIRTPFGKVYATNLTPDPEHGLGTWNASHFWRALHNGRAKDGHLLNPAFPYPHYSQITRADADIMFAYLQTLPSVRQANRQHELRWPFNTQWAIAVWRALYFKPGTYKADSSKSAQWNRGAYLTRALAHCGSCHAERDTLGGFSDDELWRGGYLDDGQWYAPSLHDARAAGVHDWTTEAIVELLSAGRNESATASGPMAEVVFRSTQHLSADDLTAMATYLRSLPKHIATSPLHVNHLRDEATMQAGAVLYRTHCEDCHGADGGGARNAYPALANNRAVTNAHLTNVIASVVHGGFSASTTRNPRPYGMPPFAQKLSAREIAAVITYIRGSWGNDASAVSEISVDSYAHGTLR